MGFVKEFKEFALKGNLIDLAIGVVIGGAFSKLTTSLINDIIMPPIGKLIGNVDFSKLSVRLQKPIPEVKDAHGVVIQKGVEEVAIRYGMFLNVVFDFVIVAFVMFMVIKAMNRLKRKEEAAPAPEPEPTKEEILLTEIRDILKNKN